MPTATGWTRRGRHLAVVALAAACPGCLTAPTRQALDRSYARADALGRTAPVAGPARAPTDSPDLSGPLDRDRVVALAVARSPALSVLAHRARALVHAGRAEGTPPAAELGLQASNLPLTRPYAAGEADMYMVELRQRFPPAGALDARARALAEEAQALLAELSSEERLVAERAAAAYADYEQALASGRLEDRQLALLERMAQVVHARYPTGGSALSDAARVELEVARSRRAVARAAGGVARAKATLNAVLRRPAGAALGEPREGAPETVTLGAEELAARADANLGATVSAAARVRAATARRQAAEAEARVPEVMVGVGYWQDPSMRPGLGVSAGMSLPWLWGPTRHRVRQAREEEAAERSARDQAGVEARTEVLGVHAELRALEAQLAVVQGRALPAARRSLEALAAAYATGGATLLDWIDVTRSMLDLEREAVELRGELARGVAALERAVGGPLPRAPLAEEPAP